MSELTEFRKSKDELFAADGHSPLTPQQQESFRNLEYYPENPQLRFEVTLEEFPDQEKEPTEIITSTGDSTTQIRWGKFNFNVEGQDVSLTVFRGMDVEEFSCPSRMPPAAVRPRAQGGIWIWSNCTMGAT